jgi:hypothetical protein
VVRALVLIAAAAVALAVVAPGLAKRAPTVNERAAITKALPASLRSVPAGCVWLDITVSRSGAFAKVSPVYLNALRQPCVRYASNGDWILRKRLAGWRVVFRGSDAPSCSLRVPRDLSPCRP